MIGRVFKLAAGNAIVLFFLLEGVMRIFPSLMPDFPQWNYGLHYDRYRHHVLERADELGVKKPAVFFLGDSFTRGAEVPLGREWVALLQRAYPDIDLINMGFGGSSTVEEYVLFEHFVLSTHAQPAAIVLNFNLTDFRGNLQHQSIFDLQGKSPFIHRLKKETHDLRLFGGLRRFLDVHSVTYRLLKYFFKGTSDYLRMPSEEGGLYIKDVDTYISGFSDYYAAEGLDAAFEATERFLDKFVSVSREKGIPIFLIYTPLKQEIYMDEFRSHNKGRNFALFEQARPFLERAAKRRNITFLDVTPAFQKRRSTAHYLTVDTHWNERGHRLMADEVVRAGFLQELRSLK